MFGWALVIPAPPQRDGHPPDRIGVSSPHTWGIRRRLRGRPTPVVDPRGGHRNPWLVWVALHTPRHSSRSALGRHVLPRYGLDDAFEDDLGWPIGVGRHLHVMASLPALGRELGHGFVLGWLAGRAPHRTDGFL